MLYNVHKTGSHPIPVLILSRMCVYMLVYILCCIIPLCYTSQPNIVILIIDDLKPVLGYYGDQAAVSPNIDKIAASAALFTHAYVQQAVCGPSRTSFLTSRTPDTTRLYDFGSYWREHAGNYTTLPQYFKEHGYRTVSMGKVFHPGISSNHSDDQPYSWTDPPYHPPAQQFKNSPVCQGVDGELHKNVFCPVNISSHPLQTLPDIQTADKAVQFLQDPPDQPYLLAVGLHKPHIPHKFPAEYLNYHPLESIKLPANNARPARLPSVSWTPYKALREREDVAKSNPSWPWGPVDDDMARLIKQGYYSATTYIDSLVGRIVEQVDNKTMIVLLGDHGWSLGEHGEWCKMSNYEEVVHVPLLVSVPGSYSQQIDQYVSLVDLFPSIVELAGLPAVAACRDRTTQLCTEGRSWASLLLQGKDNNWQDIAYSQYPRPSIYPRYDSDLPKESNIRYMGYSVRWRMAQQKNGWRCTVWMGFTAVPEPKADMTDIVGLELYNHDDDEGENNNLAKDKNQIKNINQCMELIANYIPV